MLSPNSGDQAVNLLSQISLQLAGSTNGTFPGSPTQAITQQLSSAPIVIVNVMWLMSLVLSVSSALFMTLLQRWARRYTQRPQISWELKECAHDRSFLYLGTEFELRLIDGIVPILLHLSIILFFAGLVMFFLHTHPVVGRAVAIAVTLLGQVYLVLTILPCISHNHPYHTPMTILSWYLWHISLLFEAHILHWAV